MTPVNITCTVLQDIKKIIYAVGNIMLFLFQRTISAGERIVHKRFNKLCIIIIAYTYYIASRYHAIVLKLVEILYNINNKAKIL